MRALSPDLDSNLTDPASGLSVLHFLAYARSIVALPILPFGPLLLLILCAWHHTAKIRPTNQRSAHLWAVCK